MGVVLMPTYIKYISDGYISEKDNTHIYSWYLHKLQLNECADGTTILSDGIAKKALNAGMCKKNLQQEIETYG